MTPNACDVTVPQPDMGVSRREGNCHNMEFENDDVTCCSPVKCLNIFACAFGARNNYTYV